MVSWGALRLGLWLCLAVASGGQFSSLSVEPAQPDRDRRPNLDPHFQTWLEVGVKLEFAQWPAKIKGLLKNIQERLDKLEENIRRLLIWGPRDTPRRRDVWWGCLRDHGFRLEHSFAYLRHWFFLAYAFYLAHADPSLKQLNNLKPKMAECEARYIGLFDMIQGSLGEVVIRESGSPEKFPQQGDTVIGTWLECLPTIHPDNLQILELDHSPMRGALEGLSKMLYWREVAALRRRHGANDPRDQLVQKRIIKLESIVSDALQHITPYGFDILMKMADSYMMAFTTRAQNLEYDSEARAMVSNIGLLSSAQLTLMILKSFPLPIGFPLQSTLEGALLALDFQLAEHAIILFTTLKRLNNGRALVHKPEDGSYSAMKELVLLADSVDILMRIQIFSSWLGQPDFPSKVLCRILSKLQGDTKPGLVCPEGNLDPLYYPAESGYLQLVSLLQGEPLVDGSLPTTSEQVLKLAWNVFSRIGDHLVALKEAPDNEGAFCRAYGDCADYLKAASVARHARMDRTI